MPLVDDQALGKLLNIIMADIFDHLLAARPIFELEVSLNYQQSHLDRFNVRKDEFRKEGFKFLSDWIFP